MTESNNITMFRTGQTVRFVKPYLVETNDGWVEIEVGATGCVTSVDGRFVAVTMDDEYPVLADFGNEVVFDTDVGDGVNDLAAILITGNVEAEKKRIAEKGDVTETEWATLSSSW